MTVQFKAQVEPIPGYKLIEPLGRGGFGEVWKAEAPGGVLKAIKLVHGSLRSGHGEEVLVQQELKALTCVRDVRHPYILAMDRFDIIDGQLIIVMELADKCLWDRFTECVKQKQPGIPRDELLGYMEETAEALDLMNIQYHLQHSDIKPQNLFLVHSHVKVADFGLTKDLKEMKALTSGCFSPVYSAPETFEGWVSPHSDQYSLAIVFQELLTGVRPFDGKNARQLLMQHMQQAPNLAPLPPADREAIARSLAKKPDERFKTCTELVNVLRGTPSAAVTPLPSKPPSGTALLAAPSDPATRSNAYHLTFATKCTGCSYTGRVPKKFKGLAVKCRECGLVFIATPMADSSPSTLAPAAQPTPPKPVRPAAQPVKPVAPSLTTLKPTTPATVLRPTPPAAPPRPAPAAAPVATVVAPPAPVVECPVCGCTKHVPVPSQTGSIKCQQCGCVQAAAPDALPQKAAEAPKNVAIECPVCGCKCQLPVPFVSGSIKCHQCGCVHRFE